MSEVVAIGTQRGVFLLSEVGPEWTLVGQGLSQFEVTCLRVTANSRLLAGTSGNGISYSDDHVEWRPLANSLSGRGVYSLELHPEQAEVMLAGTAPASLQLSLDSGQNFQELETLRKHPSASNWSYPEPPYRSRLLRLYLHPKDSNVFLAAVQTGGVYVSGDVGQSWHERSKGLGRTIHDLQIHPEAPGRLYAAGPIGFYLSENLGESWQERNSGLAYLHTGALAVYPDDPDILFLSSHHNARGGCALYRSSNGGQSWQACAGLPFESHLRFTCLASKAGYVMMGCSDGGLFLSRDLGVTWGKVRSNLPPLTCLKFITP